MQLRESAKLILSMFFIIFTFAAITGFCNETLGLTNQEKYEALFNHEYLHDIEIVISQEEWDGLLQDMKDYAKKFNGSLRTGNYRKAKFVYTGHAGDTVIADVGLRTKGNSTRIIPQDDNGAFHRAHFRIKFNKTFDMEEGSEAYEERLDRRFAKLRSLILRMPIQTIGYWDISQIKQLYCYDLINRAGAYTSMTGSTRLTVTIGGEQHYFGIYTLLEPVDKSFLTKRYGKDNNDGNLYKCGIGAGGPASLNPLESYRRSKRSLVGVKDWETKYLPTYDLKTNEEESDHTVLLDFIDNLNTLSGNELKTYLDNNFEADRFLRYLAMEVLIGKLDNYWINGNNYYLYFNNNGKIEFIVTDYDHALGDQRDFYGPAAGIYDWRYHFNDWRAFNLGLPLRYWNSIYPPGSPLVEKMFEIDSYRDMYEGYFKEFLDPANKLFVYSDYEDRFNRIYDLYALYLDNKINEGEEMRNEATTAEYFFERTKSVVDELGLDEAEYETSARKLAAPTGVSAADGLSDSVISVTWDPVSFADYYRIYRADSPYNNYVIVGDKIIEASFDDVPLAAGSTWYYKVKAFTGDGVESGFSIEDAGSTNDGSINTPTSVSATDGVYSHLVRITWDYVLNADYYAVYRSGSADGVYDQISKNITTSGFNDTSVSFNETYYYKVKAFKDDGAETGFSLADSGFASESGTGAPHITRGEISIKGTYVQKTDQGTKTYSFKDDTTCTVSAPGFLGKDIIKHTGTWVLNGNSLTIDYISDNDQYSGLAKVHITEVWDNVFTTNNGSGLHLMGLQKTVGNQDRIPGLYISTSSIQLISSGILNKNYSTTLKDEAVVNDNGTGTMVSTFTTGDQSSSFSVSWTETDNNLIEVSGTYYLPPVSNAFLFIRQDILCPLSMALQSKKHLNLMRKIRDLNLMTSTGFNLVNMYYSHAPEISSILSNNPALLKKLRNLVTQNIAIADHYLKNAQATFGNKIRDDILALLNEIKEAGSHALKKDIDFVIEGIKDEKLLKGVRFN